MMQTFEAVVIRCIGEGERYAVELDRTAFFPEGGGQACDTGTLNEAQVYDVQIREGCVMHYTDRPFETGETVKGSIDWEIRFRRMQNHTGEHILSGTLHRLYGANNVGFHLGSKDVTVDTDVILTRDQLAAAEFEANLAVAKNLPVIAFKPDSEKAQHIAYRSKKEIDHDLRLVQIEGVDCCACCAPHVPFTGSVGVIKILDAIHYKGGMRLHILCGLDAVAYWEIMYRDHAAAATSMSVKQLDVTDAVSRILKERADLEIALREEKRRRARAAADRIGKDERRACLHIEDADMDELREAALHLSARQDGVFIVWSEKEEDLAFAGASRDCDMRIAANELRRNWQGRCGGSGRLIQGTCRIDPQVLAEKTADWYNDEIKCKSCE